MAGSLLSASLAVAAMGGGDTSAALAWGSPSLEGLAFGGGVMARPDLVQQTPFHGQTQSTPSVEYTPAPTLKDVKLIHTVILNVLISTIHFKLILNLHKN